MCVIAYFELPQLFQDQTSESKLSHVMCTLESLPHFACLKHVGLSTFEIVAFMSRKGVGLAAFDRSRIKSAQYASHGNNLRSSHSTSVATQLSVFRSLLQQFAQTHAKDIRSNPSFRAEFARMCAAIGVDPLASSSGAGGKDGAGSFWAQLLGGSVNDFYFELAVRVVEVCDATREENGGLIGVKEVRDRITVTRMEGSSEITE